MESTRCRICWISALISLLLLVLLYSSIRNTNQLYLPADEVSTIPEQPTQKSSLQKSSSNLPEKLSRRVINRVKLFVLFVGHAHSGHSVVGSILDSHPHIVVSHELSLFSKMDVHPEWSKSDIFNAIWQRSIESSTSGLRTDKKKAYRKGYSLAIPNLYQGTYESYIEVIGDKKGGTMARMLMSNPEHWKQTLDRLKSVTGVPVKIFHVIRNPFDNIATTVLFSARKSPTINTKSITKLKQEGRNYSLDPKWIDKHIRGYFNRFQAIEDAKVRFELDVINVHGKDLIDDPKKVISEMCDFLQVTCSDHFISVCSDKIFPKESKTRYQLHWEDYQIKEVQQKIKEFSNLHRYIEFDS